MRGTGSSFLVQALLALSVIAGSAAALYGATFAAAGQTLGEIAYPGNGKIYLTNADGTGQRVLISGGSRFKVDHWGGIAWSRDGNQIAFTVGDHRAGDRYGDTLRLYVAAADGTNARPLGGTPRGSFDPTWSPDGSRIAFAIRGADETSIAVVGVDGKGFKKLTSSTNPRDMYWVPDWSPNGDWILFDMGRMNGVRSRLMAIRPDGTRLHQLAAFNTDNHCICADWSPDGDHIAYQAPGTPPRYDYPRDLDDERRRWRTPSTHAKSNARRESRLVP